MNKENSIREEFEKFEQAINESRIPLDLDACANFFLNLRKSELQELKGKLEEAITTHNNLADEKGLDSFAGEGYRMAIKHIKESFSSIINTYL